jgi:hypothetical protein
MVGPSFFQRGNTMEIDSASLSARMPRLIAAETRHSARPDARIPALYRKISYSGTLPPALSRLE